MELDKNNNMHIMQWMEWKTYNEMHIMKYMAYNAWNEKLFQLWSNHVIIVLQLEYMNMFVVENFNIVLLVQLLLLCQYEAL